MSYVQVNFPLPTITGKGGAILPYRFNPGRCALNVKKGISGKGATPSNTIRKAMPRAKLTLVHRNTKDQVALSGFWSGTVAALKGAVQGFAVGGPAGAIAGAAAGRIQDAQSSKAKNAAAQTTVAAGTASGLGPLAGVSTGTVVGIALGFSALIIVLARGGR